MVLGSDQSAGPAGGEASRLRRVWVLLLSMGLVLAAGAYVKSTFFPSKSRLSADEIVSRAAANQRRVRSWHIRYVKKQGHEGKHSTVQTEESWCSGPDRFRTIYASPKSHGLVVTQSGTRTVCLDSDRHFAVVSPVPSDSVAKARARNVEQTRARYHLKGWSVVRAERIAGRVCDVIAGEEGSYRVTYAFDRTSGFCLRRTWKGGGFTGSSLVTDFSTGLPPRRFLDTAIPKGTTVVKGPPDIARFGREINADLSELPEQMYAAAWQAVSREYACSVSPQAACVPSYLPRGFRLLGVTPGKYDSMQAVQAPLKIFCIEPCARRCLVLSQTGAREESRGKSVRVGGAEGRLVEGSRPYRYSILSWGCNGTSLSLFGAEISKTELMKVAESVHPLSDPAPGAWRIVASAAGSEDDVRRAAVIVEKRLACLELAGASVSTDGKKITVTANGGGIEILRQIITTPGRLSCVPIPDGISVDFDQAHDMKPFLRIRDGRRVYGEQLLRAETPVIQGEHIFLDSSLDVSPDTDILFLSISPKGRRLLHEHARKKPYGDLAILLDRTFLGYEPNSNERGDHPFIIVQNQPADLTRLARAVARSGEMPARLRIISASRLR